MLTPLLIFAAPATGTLNTIIKKILLIVNAVVPIVMTLAVIFFIISLLMYLLKEGEEKAKAKTQMIWGIVILFAIVSMWGLVAVLGATFGVSAKDAPTVDLTPGVTALVI